MRFGKLLRNVPAVVGVLGFYGVLCLVYLILGDPDESDAALAAAFVVLLAFMAFLVPRGEEGWGVFGITWVVGALAWLLGEKLFDVGNVVRFAVVVLTATAFTYIFYDRGDVAGEPGNP